MMKAVNRERGAVKREQSPYLALILTATRLPLAAHQQ